MGLAASITKRLDVPGEAGAWIEIRALTGPQLDAARAEASRKAMSVVAGLHPDAVMGIVASQRDRPRAAAESTDYDPDAMVNAAVVRWSYSDMAVGPSGYATPAPSGLLDAPTRDWLAKEVEAMNVRPPKSAAGSVG